jgi:hypothetical protein
MGCEVGDAGLEPKHKRRQLVFSSGSVVGDSGRVGWAGWGGVCILSVSHGTWFLAHGVVDSAVGIRLRFMDIIRFIHLYLPVADGLLLMYRESKVMPRAGVTM